jgi:hypothetical protein
MRWIAASIDIAARIHRRQESGFCRGRVQHKSFAAEAALTGSISADWRRGCAMVELRIVQIMLMQLMPKQMQVEPELTIYCKGHEGSLRSVVAQLACLRFAFVSFLVKELLFVRGGR